MMRVNMMSVVFGLKHAAPHMTAGGSIINTSSLAGLTGFPTYGAYSASKAAIVSLTRVAAVEYGPLGIRVNAICPSSVDTPMLAAQPGGEVETAVAEDRQPAGPYDRARGDRRAHALPGRRRLPGDLRAGAGKVDAGWLGGFSLAAVSALASAAAPAGLSACPRPGGGE